MEKLVVEINLFFFTFHLFICAIRGELSIQHILQNSHGISI